jgi:hypothetical protein
MDRQVNIFSKNGRITDHYSHNETGGNDQLTSIILKRDINTLRRRTLISQHTRRES